MEIRAEEIKNNPNKPQHVAIIMDGNGRWAKKRGLPRVMGHNEGVKNRSGDLNGIGRSWNKIFDHLCIFQTELESPERRSFFDHDPFIKNGPKRN